MRRRRRPTLHHAVKDKRVTVLGPVKQPEMDFMSHRGVIGRTFWGGDYKGGRGELRRMKDSTCPHGRGALWAGWGVGLVPTPTHRTIPPPPEG